jgi:exopolysaccharide biosynthesis polyprenyl glycosylphosphotransferase
VALLDLLGLNLAFAVAGWIRFDDLRTENPEYYDYYLQLLAFFNLSWLAILGLFRHHRLGPQAALGPPVGRFLQALAWQLALTALLVVLLKGYYYSRLFLLFYFAGFLMLGVGFRLAILQWLLLGFKQGKWARRVALAGRGTALNALVPNLQADASFGVHITAHWTEPVESMNPRPDELWIAEEGQAAFPWVRWAENQGLRWRLLTDAGPLRVQPHAVEWVAGALLLQPRSEPLAFAPNRWIKRTADVLLAAIIAVTVLPLLLLVTAIGQWAQSPGPLFFVQTRSGLVGRPFKMFKLRTMRPDNPNPEQQAKQGDDRVFPLGRWLRRSGLDEVPQVLNVLQGQMSIIGPRPHMVEHTEAFRSRTEAFMIRHQVKPGITGLAQVQGFRGELFSDADLEERLRADVYYLEHWSPLMDLKILLLTAWRLLKPGKGAY